MGQLQPELTASGVRTLAVAVTPTFAQQRFAEELGVDFPLLSDWDRTACTAYGVRYDSWKGHAGLAKRSLFLVDGGGTVRYRWVTDDAMVQPDLDEVMAHVREVAAEGR